MKDDDLEDTYFDIAIENEFEFLIEQDEVDVCYIKMIILSHIHFFLSEMMRCLHVLKHGRKV